MWWFGVGCIIAIAYLSVIQWISTSEYRNEPAIYPFIVVQKAAPTVHICDTPDFFDRRSLKLKTGAVVQCKDCGQYWMFDRVYDSGRVWFKVDDPV